jgi:hypothetical protein
MWLRIKLKLLYINFQRQGKEFFAQEFFASLSRNHGWGSDDKRHIKVLNQEHSHTPALQ